MEKLLTRSNYFFFHRRLIANNSFTTNLNRARNCIKLVGKIARQKYIPHCLLFQHLLPKNIIPSFRALRPQNHRVLSFKNILFSTSRILTHYGQSRKKQERKRKKQKHFFFIRIGFFFFSSSPNAPRSSASASASICIKTKWPPQSIQSHESSKQKQGAT